MLIVLTGKTASGKDTIGDILLKKYQNLKKLTTTTARTKREREVNGVDYNFITQGEFKKKINNNKFLEYVEYGGNLYGTEKTEFIHDGMILWKIDPSRAGKVRELISKKLMVIYITTDEQEILKRLEKRGLSKEEIRKRMLDDKEIWEKYKNSYDFVIENVPGKLDETINKIVAIIKS